MKPLPPLTKVEMIERSLSCFHLGLLGLLPFIGLPMAVRSLVHFRRVTAGQSAGWNPARRYLHWGARCAWIGLALFLLLPLVVAIGMFISSFP